MIHVTIVVERSVKSISKEANPVLERSSSSKLFALPAVNNGIIHQGWRLVGLLSVVSVCQTEVGRHERTSGKLVTVSTSIKPSKYHRSIGGTPEATSAIIHQRIFVTCKRHFSSQCGSIPNPLLLLPPSIYPSLLRSFCSTAYVAQRAR